MFLARRPILGHPMSFDFSSGRSEWHLPGLETLLYLLTRARNRLERRATSASPPASRRVVEDDSWVGSTLSPRFSLAM